MKKTKLCAQIRIVSLCSEHLAPDSGDRDSAGVCRGEKLLHRHPGVQSSLLDSISACRIGILRHAVYMYAEKVTFLSAFQGRKGGFEVKSHLFCVYTFYLDSGSEKTRSRKQTLEN
jgi:hypothetical protein